MLLDKIIFKKQIPNLITEYFNYFFRVVQKLLINLGLILN